MGRNLDRRVEVSVHSRPAVAGAGWGHAGLQLKDNVTRKLDVQLRNKFVAGRSKRVKLDCQQALYERYLNEN